GKLNGPRYVSAGESDEQGTRYLQGAAVIMEVGSGDVIAMVGGRDFLDSPFNRATQSQRQVGSAFKPFVFATAIGGGFSPSQHLVDEPISFNMTRQKAYEPRNYDGLFYGEISLRQTLVESRNVPTVRLADAVGLENVRQTAVRAGITGDMPLHPSMPLGTVASNPLELAHAYTVFPGLGVQPEPRYITSVVNEDGDTIWSIDAVRSGGGLDPRVAYVITDMLRDAVDYGTGAAVRSAGYYGATAGKTGTTNEGTDAWFVGFTPDLVGAVWVGFDQQRSITGNASGGRLAAPIWGRIMRRVYANRPDPGDFEVPAGIVHRMTDPESGLVLQDGCFPRWEDPVREVFLEGQQAETICPHYGNALDDWISGILRRLQGGREDEVESSDEVNRRADEMRRAQDRLRKGNQPRN
ncbi:MAG: penicillin-binding transpeptidase domain-containing protein, partial [Longimicrobiales bacterium]